jgi:hypothetical protein
VAESIADIPILWGGPEMTAAATTLTQPTAATQALRSMRIYEYSDLVYWWAIWLAALVCIFLTYFFGESIKLTENPPALKFHTSPWLGIVFLVVMFATLIFTQLRARGLHAIIFGLVVVVLGLIVHMTIGWTAVFAQITLIKVHMNLAYYMITFVVTFAVWLYTTFVHASLSYGVVNPGEVGWRSALTGQIETFKPLNFQVLKRSDDIIVHKILGLGFLGFGTGDIEVKFDVPGGGSQHHSFKNVWRPDVKVALMEALISRES